MQELEQRPELEEPEAELDAEQMAEVREEFAEMVQEGAEAMKMENFSEPKAHGAHQHGPQKHDVRSAFSVNPDLIENHFPDGVLPNGHEALHVLVAGKDEFVAADEDVFVDTHDTNTGRWNAIEEAASQAPIPPAREAEISSRFEE